MEKIVKIGRDNAGFQNEYAIHKTPQGKSFTIVATNLQYN